MEVADFLRVPTQILTANWIFPISSPPVQDAYLVLDNGRIAAIGPLASHPEFSRWPKPLVGTLLTPGLVNTHLHLEQTFPQPIRKVPEQPFVEWLLGVIQATRPYSTPDEKRARCEQGVTELLRTGTTCVNDIASGPESLQVLGTRGLRGIVSLECFHPGFETIQVQFIIDAFQAFRAACLPYSRLQAGLSPHSPYNVSPSAWRHLLAVCQPDWIHTHAAEFADECAYLAGLPSAIPSLHERVLGKSFRPESPVATPIDYLHQHHLLTGKTILAHCTHVTPLNWAVLATEGVRVAHCPRSNLALHGETLQTTLLQEVSVPLGLGTDGRLSTDDLDLRAEARVAQSIHGWTDAQTLEAMTLSGAHVLGLTSQIGSLERGKQADLTLWQAPPTLVVDIVSQNTGSEHLRSPESLVLSPETTVLEVFTDAESRWRNNALPGSSASALLSTSPPVEAFYV